MLPPSQVIRIVKPPLSSVLAARVNMDALLASLADYVSETAVEGPDFDYILPTQAGWDSGAARSSVRCIASTAR